MTPSKKLNLDSRLVSELGEYGHRDESWDDVVARVLAHVDKEAALDDRKNRTTTFDRGRNVTTRHQTGLQSLEEGTIVRHRFQRGGFSGEIIEAEVRNGAIEYDGERYTPSAAATEADRELRGTEAASAHNGWEWWEFQDDDGDWIQIDTLRE